MTYENAKEMAFELSTDASKALRRTDLTHDQAIDLKESLDWFNERILCNLEDSLAIEPCAIWEYGMDLMDLLRTIDPKQFAR